MKHLATAISGVIAVLGFCIGASAGWDDGYSDARRLREFIDEQVGGIHKLKVPAKDTDLPVPRNRDGTMVYRYQTTEAKRYLGKLLFHDPVRTARIGNADSPNKDTNIGQPKNLPMGSSFGGTQNAADTLVQKILPLAATVTTSQSDNIIAATLQTGSCGACHIGEAAGKAGQQLNFNVGGEGRGYTDENGNFFPRRRPQAILAQLRTEPIFSGDGLVDALPTLTDIWVDHGTDVITTPAYFYHYPNPPGALNPPAASADPNLQLLATGRLDQLDSVARMSPAMVGFAFNNRLLLGGFAGEPQSTPGSLNPFNDPAQENLTLLLLDAHRMLNFQAAVLRGIPTFVKLFKDAFPQEAAQDPGDNTTLINDDTVFRATSTFLRTVVTRNTPFDKFLAGDDRALTPSQLRGAKLFFTPAAGGAGGAGCFSCHSGPMLNKQHNDPAITGVGQFVEENFVNVGIGDHPVQALNALARGHLNPANLGTDGFPYHAEDTGRQEITKNPQNADAFKFRVLTLRQVKDGRNFMHNASFTKVRDVVEYFNTGVPQDPTAASLPTLDARFTNPRGPGFANGLGLSKREVADLTDFLENGLYDSTLVKYDPNSTTDTLQPNPRDLAYSKYRPDLAALGAKDGFMLSGLAIDDNDPLTRRDEGLEFLNVTGKLGTQVRKYKAGDDEVDTYQIVNTSSTVVDTHLLVIVHGLPKQIRMENASGTTKAGDPYVRVFLPGGVLNPGQAISQRLVFERNSNARPFSYTLAFLSGQGKP